MKSAGKLLIALAVMALVIIPLSGCTGPDGAQGLQGTQLSPELQVSQGPQGPQGERGLKGGRGSVGSQGPQGPAGADGADGADGAVGPQGPQGNMPEWGAYETKSFVQSYTAATDGMVVAYGTDTDLAGTATVKRVVYIEYSGTSVCPRTTYDHTTAQNTTIGASITMPVRSGDKWTVTMDGVGATGEVRWIPLN